MLFYSLSYQLSILIHCSAAGHRRFSSRGASLVFSIHPDTVRSLTLSTNTHLLLLLLAWGLLSLHSLGSKSTCLSTSIRHHWAAFCPHWVFSPARFSWAEFWLQHSSVFTTAWMLSAHPHSSHRCKHECCLFFCPLTLMLNILLHLTASVICLPTSSAWPKLNCSFSWKISPFAKSLGTINNSAMTLSRSALSVGVVQHNQLSHKAQTTRLWFPPGSDPKIFSSATHIIQIWHALRFHTFQIPPRNTICSYRLNN